jgi:hypothetical protein
MIKCESMEYIIYTIITILLLFLEMYLGKTKTIKSNSTLELIYNVLKQITKRK